MLCIYNTTTIRLCQYPFLNFFGGIVMTFSERILYLRKSRNLTQKQVYEAVGMSALGYQRYEYGEREPAYQKLIALADFFDVSLDYLVGRSDDPKRY